MQDGTFREIVMALPDTEARPHFDRVAFRTPRRTFATLAPDGLSANLMLEPDHQAQLVAAHPEAFEPVPGGWGRQGWTTMTLAEVDAAEAKAVLTIAHAMAAPVVKPARGQRAVPKKKPGGGERAAGPRTRTSAKSSVHADAQPAIKAPAKRKADASAQPTIKAAAKKKKADANAKPAARAAAKKTARAPKRR